jgi:hypothetical protein
MWWWWGLLLDWALWPVQWLLQRFLKPLPSQENDKPLLIFIYDSGFPAHWPARILQKRFRVVLVPLAKDGTLSDQMDYAARVILVGYGQGGLVAAAAAAVHPEVETIVTINTPWEDRAFPACDRVNLICFGSRFDSVVPWLSSYPKECHHAIMHPFGHTSVGFFPTLWEQVGQALNFVPSKTKDGALSLLSQTHMD